MIDPNDPSIMRPAEGGGHVLTNLGCLLYGPWQISSLDGYNVKVYIDDKEIQSFGVKYTDIEKDLVFELQKNGEVKYWFKKDYVKKMTSVDSYYKKQGAEYTTRYRPGVDIIKKLYTDAKWNVNFKDSTLNIQFNDPNLPKLSGRYSYLGSDNLDFQRTSFFDSTINKQKVKLKKVVTTYYNHPWVNW